MIRRGANVSRAALAAPTTLRSAGSARVFGRQAPPAVGLPLLAPPAVIESSCLHVECKLPINLRRFLAGQLGLMADSGDEAIMNVAASADPATLSKIARAIRRYSTARAHEEWAECSVELSQLAQQSAGGSAQVTLCLKCAVIEFGATGVSRHDAPVCQPVDLTKSCGPRERGAVETGVAKVQRVIEEFRALRVAFGLPHFELDCYPRGNQIVFTWRPLP